MDTTIEPLFLGRQPILDCDHNLVGFELLFRSGEGNTAVFSDDLSATATVINYTFNEIGVEATLGPYQGFINLNEPLLMSDIIEFLPEKKIVLEILESVRIDEAIIDRCKFLKNMGFRIALDDVTHFPPALTPIVALANIVKIDLIAVEAEQLDALVDQFKKWPLKLLAEKVENAEQFNRCLELGFELFQGYYFARPHIITGKRLSHSEMALMKLLGLVLDEAETDEIEQELKGNPLLSYNLLKLSNQAATGISRKITSIKSALTILGRRQLQRWIQILLYSHSGNSTNTFNNPLLQLAATRGKTMECLAAKIHDTPFQDKAFMTGIMSLMDTLLSMPIAEIVASLPISQDIKAALLAREGELGKLLNLVEDLERKNPAAIELPDLPYLTFNDLSIAHIEALAWSNSITQTHA